MKQPVLTQRVVFAPPKAAILRKQLAQRRYVDSGFIAYDYAALGDKEQTFYWLEKAYSEKAGSLGYIKVVKVMDLSAPIRGTSTC